MEKNVIKQSETFRRSYIFRHAQTKEPLDLTGCTVFSQMRDKPGGELIADATCIVDTSLGRITVEWTSEQTAEIDPGMYVFDAWIKCGDDQKPFVTESVEVIPSVTVISEEA